MKDEQYYIKTIMKIYSEGTTYQRVKITRLYRTGRDIEIFIDHQVKEGKLWRKVMRLYLKE